MTQSNLNQLLRVFDQAYNRKSWHGTGLRGSLRSVTAAEAARRPANGRHNIWEIVLHAAYWKYTLLRRLTGGRHGSFPVHGSNWFVRPAEESGDRPWRRDVALLDDTHRQLRVAIASLSPRAIDATPPGSKVSNFAMITGIAAHDLYHAGQIQLVKRLIRTR